MNRYLEKLAIHIHLYVHKDDESKKKWLAEGKPIPEGFIKAGPSFYRRKSQGKKK